jgi:hypothetical protein
VADHRIEHQPRIGRNIAHHPVEMRLTAHHRPEMAVDLHILELGERRFGDHLQRFAGGIRE